MLYRRDGKLWVKNSGLYSLNKTEKLAGRVSAWFDPPIQPLHHHRSRTCNLPLQQALRRRGLRADQLSVMCAGRSPSIAPASVRAIQQWWSLQL